MTPTQQLHDLGQSLWLDNITRNLPDSGTLKRYIEELSITGLTSNPTVFGHAITKSASYDAEIRRLVGHGLSGEKLFFELALQDLTRAADLQTEGTQAFDDSWQDLLKSIQTKSHALKQTA
jgi:transaldolase